MLKTLNLEKKVAQKGRLIIGNPKNVAKSADTKAKKQIATKDRPNHSKGPKIIGKTPNCLQKSRKRIKRSVTGEEKGNLNMTPMKLPAIITNAEETNLDNNCYSCLIFPEKDGSFILPTKEPEDELDQLVKNYHKSEMEYLMKVRKFTSYGASPPMFPSIIPKKEVHYDRSYGDNQLTYSPATKDRNTCEKGIRKVISEGPVRRVKQIYGESVLYKKPKMVTAHYQSSGEGETTPTRADSAALSSFVPSGKNRFPREIFSLGSRCKRPIA